MLYTGELISVCIITYKRPASLERLLESIAKQTISINPLHFEVIVVDNDKRESAKEIVERFSISQQHLQVTYDVEPIQNIALARNRSVRLAKGAFISFVDDDEEADPYWIENLYKSFIAHSADAVFGPVIPVLPDECPLWIRKGNFFDRPQHADGSAIDNGRTGNALLRRKWIEFYEEPFDVNMGLIGGSDFDFFDRIREEGAKLCWADGARVLEYVGHERLNLKWLLGRAFRGGQGFAQRNLQKKGATGKLFHFSYRLALLGFAFLMACATMPFGYHQSVWWLRKVFTNLGQISVFLPYRYMEYKKR